MLVSVPLVLALMAKDHVPLLARHDGLICGCDGCRRRQRLIGGRRADLIDSFVVLALTGADESLKVVGGEFRALDRGNQAQRFCVCDVAAFQVGARRVTTVIARDRSESDERARCCLRRGMLV